MIFSREELIKMYFYCRRMRAGGNSWLAYLQGPVFKKPEHFRAFASRGQAEEFVRLNTTLLNVYGLQNLRGFEKLTGRILLADSLPLIINTNEYVLINNKVMNIKNVEYLKDNLKFLGFGDKLNEALENEIKQQKPSFTLHAQIPHYNNVAAYRLHFNKSEQSELYFLNKMDASISQDIKIPHVIHNGIDTHVLESRLKSIHENLQNSTGQTAAAEDKKAVLADLNSLSAHSEGKLAADRIIAKYLGPADFQGDSKQWEGALKVLDEHKVSQSFYLNNGKGFTAKEAFNLLEGRAVNKDLINKAGEKYNAWIQLDLKEKGENDLHPVRQYHSAYGFDLEKELGKTTFKELGDSMQKEDLIKSLRRGNRSMVNVETQDGNRRQFIEANPRERKIDRYYPSGEPIQAVSLAPEQKQGESKNQRQTRDPATEQKQNRKKSHKISH